MTHRIPRAETVEGAEPLEVACFHPDSDPDHRPETHVRLAHDGRALRVRFDVADRYVLCRNTAHQGPVCKDSCVELFVAPGERDGYFNFEVNCGGAVLLHHNRPTGDGRYAGEALEARWIEALGVETALEAPIDPERPEPVAWWVTMAIPFALFEAHAGIGPPARGDVWRANFYKCADASSHPHWASWADIGPKRNFHQPDRFGELVF